MHRTRFAMPFLIRNDPPLPLENQFACPNAHSLPKWFFHSVWRAYHLGGALTHISKDPVHPTWPQFFWLRGMTASASSGTSRAGVHGSGSLELDAGLRRLSGGHGRDPCDVGWPCGLPEPLPKIPFTVGQGAGNKKDRHSQWRVLLLSHPDGRPSLIITPRATSPAPLWQGLTYGLSLAEATTLQRPPRKDFDRRT
jgi:hypothetical protein